MQSYKNQISVGSILDIVVAKIVDDLMITNRKQYKYHHVIQQKPFASRPQLTDRK